MLQILDPVLIAALALNFVALGVSRIRGVIRAVAWQGVLLGVCPLIIQPRIEPRGLLLVIVAIGLKGIVIPTLLLRAMRAAEIQHVVTPYVGYMASLVLGAIGAGLALVGSSTLPLADEHSGSMIVPASLATVWCGFLLLTTRRIAINQVLGYLILENGIFLFGLLLLQAVPLLVELGVLLDLFTGVFVMGIIIHHINRQFASGSTEHLSELKE
jgi:hydrogenase-4 component E